MICIKGEWFETDVGMDKLDFMAKKSNKIFDITCDFQVDEKCKKTYSKQYKNIFEDVENNNGKLICLFCSFKVSSKQISKDLCRHLQINYGKKSYSVRFPKLEKFNEYFLRGYFEGDGFVRDPTKSKIKRHKMWNKFFFNRNAQ